MFIFFFSFAFSRWIKKKIYICLKGKYRLTGVNKSGVADADDSSVVNLIPEPKSKSQILIGHNFSVDTHKMFSGFRSRWAMPFLCKKSNPDAISLMIWAASCSEKQTCSWILVSNGPPLIWIVRFPCKRNACWMKNKHRRKEKKGPIQLVTDKSTEILCNQLVCVWQINHHQLIRCDENSFAGRTPHPTFTFSKTR